MPENFFVLSKGNLELAADEVAAIAKSYDPSAEIDVDGNLILVRTRTPWQKIHLRASYVKISGQTARSISELSSESAGRMLAGAKTFACKVLNLSKDRFDPVGLEKSMGDEVSRHSSARVSLTSPDLTVYMILAENRSLFGFSTKLGSCERPRRAESHPNQLDSKLSRAMINLCGLKENQTVCDPFCGTGTTLLEAESMGMHGIGIDIDKKMCCIAEKNVLENGYGSEIINDDFRHIAGISDRFDGIVTDIPYGQNSKVPTEPEVLMRDLIKGIPRGKRFAIMCKEEFARGISAKDVKRYSIYRHKSLTRTILVK